MTEAEKLELEIMQKAQQLSALRPQGTWHEGVPTTLSNPARAVRRFQPCSAVARAIAGHSQHGAGLPPLHAMGRWH